MRISSRESYYINFPITIVHKDAMYLAENLANSCLPSSLSPTIIETRKQRDETPYPPIVSYRFVTTCTSSMRDFGPRDSGPHYRLVRPMRSGHSEVARRYRILSSPLDLQARCMRACMRVRSVVGGARLPVDYAPTVLSSSREGKSKRRAEKIGTRV